MRWLWFLVNDRVKLLAYRIFDPVKAEPSPTRRPSRSRRKAEPKPKPSRSHATSDLTPQIAKRAYELYEERASRTVERFRTGRRRSGTMRKDRTAQMNGREQRVGMTERMKMKINSKDFRVPAGKAGRPREVADDREARLQVEEAIQETPGRTRGGAELAATPSLRVQPLCAAADLSGDGRCRQGRRHPARHVRGQSARLPGVQLQTPERRGAGARFSLAHDPLVCRSAAGSASSTVPTTRRC